MQKGILCFFSIKHESFEVKRKWLHEICPSISEETNTAHKISSTVITLEKLFFWSTGKTEKQIGR